MKLKVVGSFQTTYEELKLWWAHGLLPLRRLPDYLWGIETRSIKVEFVIEEGFQTTYEELKQVYQVFIDESLLRFQTTYEELKLILNMATEQKPIRFQTTYEELKLSSARLSSIPR